MHHVLRADQIRPRPAETGSGKGFARCSLVDREAGSVDEHLHSFEESFYVLDGSPVLVLEGRAYRLQPGACGVVPVGVRHGWLGDDRETARWIDMYAPQPRVDGAGGA